MLQMGSDALCMQLKNYTLHNKVVETFQVQTCAYYMSYYRSNEARKSRVHVQRLISLLYIDRMIASL